MHTKKNCIKKMDTRELEMTEKELIIIKAKNHLNRKKTNFN